MGVYVGKNSDTTGGGYIPVAKKVSKIYVGDENGIARLVKKAYVGVDGIAKLFWGGVQEEELPFLEYIESTGTQWIDPDVVPKLNYRVEIGFQHTRSESTGEAWIYGVWETQGFRCGLASGKFDTTRGFTYSQTSDKNAYTTAIGVNTIRDYTGKAYLFAQQENGNAGYLVNGKFKLYYCKIYDNNNNLIRDFKPCKDPNGVVCLYDLVEQKYYYTQGTGTFIGGKEINTSQVINYLMLYDYGYECVDVTGGWSTYGLYGSPTISKNSDHLYIDIPRGWKTGAFGMGKQVNFAGYSLLFARYSGKGFYDSAADIYNRAISVRTDKHVVSSYGSWNDGSNVGVDMRLTGAQKEHIETRSLENAQESYYVNCGLNIGNGHSGTLKVFALALTKSDDWESLANLAGVTASSIDDILTNSGTLLNNENAVKFMIYNCTGDFMVSAIQSSTFLTALNNSPYKTLIQANEHWNKFLNMVA